MATVGFKGLNWQIYNLGLLVFRPRYVIFHQFLSLSLIAAKFSFMFMATMYCQSCKAKQIAALPGNLICSHGEGKLTAVLTRGGDLSVVGLLPVYRVGQIK